MTKHLRKLAKTRALLIETIDAHYKDWTELTFVGARTEAPISDDEMEILARDLGEVFRETFTGGTFVEARWDYPKPLQKALEDEFDALLDDLLSDVIEAVDDRWASAMIIVRRVGKCEACTPYP